MRECSTTRVAIGLEERFWRDAHDHQRTITLRGKLLSQGHDLVDNFLHYRLGVLHDGYTVLCDPILRYIFSIGKILQTTRFSPKGTDAEVTAIKYG